MKIEFIKTNVSSKHKFQILVDGEVVELNNKLSRIITNTTSEYNQGIFSNNQHIAFHVNNEEKTWFIPYIQRYNLTNDEFQKWIDVVKEVRHWADSIHSKNETIIFTANI